MGQLWGQLAPAETRGPLASCLSRARSRATPPRSATAQYNEIQVDVTGDLRLVNDKLILDLSFTATAPVPGPVAGAHTPALPSEAAKQCRRVNGKAVQARRLPRGP